MANVPYYILRGRSLQSKCHPWHRLTCRLKMYALWLNAKRRAYEKKQKKKEMRAIRRHIRHSRHTRRTFSRAHHEARYVACCEKACLFWDIRTPVSVHAKKQSSIPRFPTLTSVICFLMVLFFTYAAYSSLMLMRSGDIEMNPGPMQLDVILRDVGLKRVTHNDGYRYTAGDCQYDCLSFLTGIPSVDIRNGAMDCLEDERNKRTSRAEMAELCIATNAPDSGTSSGEEGMLQYIAGQRIPAGRKGSLWGDGTSLMFAAIFLNLRIVPWSMQSCCAMTSQGAGRCVNIAIDDTRGQEGHYEPIVPFIYNTLSAQTQQKRKDMAMTDLCWNTASTPNEMELRKSISTYENIPICTAQNKANCSVQVAHVSNMEVLNDSDDEWIPVRCSNKKRSGPSYTSMALATTERPRTIHNQNYFAPITCKTSNMPNSIPDTEDPPTFNFQNVGCLTNEIVTPTQPSIMAQSPNAETPSSHPASIVTFEHVTGTCSCMGVITNRRTRPRSQVDIASTCPHIREALITAKLLSDDELVLFFMPFMDGRKMPQGIDAFLRAEFVDGKKRTHAHVCKLIRKAKEYVKCGTGSEACEKNVSDVELERGTYYEGHKTHSHAASITPNDCLGNSSSFNDEHFLHASVMKPPPVIDDIPTTTYGVLMEANEQECTKTPSRAMRTMRLRPCSFTNELRLRISQDNNVINAAGDKYRCQEALLPYVIEFKGLLPRGAPGFFANAMQLNSPAQVRNMVKVLHMQIRDAQWILKNTKMELGRPISSIGTDVEVLGAKDDIGRCAILCKYFGATGLQLGTSKYFAEVWKVSIPTIYKLAWTAYEKYLHNSVAFLTFKEKVSTKSYKGESIVMLSEKLEIPFNIVKAWMKCIKTREKIAKKALEEYASAIKETPDWPCNSCRMLFFFSDLRPLDNKYAHNINVEFWEVLSSVPSHFRIGRKKHYKAKGEKLDVTSESMFFCNSCLSHMLSTVNDADLDAQGDFRPPRSYLRFPDALASVQNLNKHESRLVAPRIAFAQITECPQHQHTKLKGGVVNVPADMDKIQTTLPRLPDEVQTVALRLWRRLGVHRPYASGNVRPKCVMKALIDLCDTPLYRNDHVKVRADWVRLWLDAQATFKGINANNAESPIPTELETHQNGIGIDTPMSPIHEQNSCNSIEIGSDNSHGGLHTSGLARTHDRGIILGSDDSGSDNADGSYAGTNSGYSLSNKSTQSQPYDRDECSTENEDKEMSGDAHVPEGAEEANWDVEMNGMILNEDEMFDVADVANPCLPYDPQDNLLEDIGNASLPTIQEEGDVSELEEDNKDWASEDEISSDGSDGYLPPDAEAPPPMDTMLYDLLDANEIRDKLFDVAPGEGNVVRSMFMDPNCEEKAFPKIFHGQPRYYGIPEHKLTYTDLAKWEMCNMDQRVANDPENIFFKMRMKQASQLRQIATTSVRIGALGERKIVAKDLHDADAMANLLDSYAAFSRLEQVRTSPNYLSARRRELFAKIRQVGCPTWFLTLNCADTTWPELLASLYFLEHGELPTRDELNNLVTKKEKKDEVANMMRKNPVLSARYCERRFVAFMNLLKKDTSILGDVHDYFRIIEEQRRGCKHLHAMLHDRNAPRYNIDSDEKVCEYIDKFITCSSEGLEEDVIKVHTHRHTFTCGKKWHKGVCRFHAPWPPMPHTKILRKADKDHLSAADRRNYAIMNIRVKQTMKELYMGTCTLNMNSTFPQFLSHVKCTEEQYYKVISLNLKRDMVCVKRAVKDVRMNTFSKSAALIWKGNCDMQFILNGYAATAYVTSYITKENKALSALLQTLERQSQMEKKSTYEVLREAGIAIMNETEIPIQQAVDFVSGTPFYEDSRGYIYINTSPPDERERCLRRKEETKYMDPACEDVFYDNILIKYEKADEVIGITEMCLADFACEMSFNRDNGCWQKKTGQPRIMRCRRYNEEKDPENFYREQVTLFYPFRQESDLKQGCETWHAVYEAHFDVISENKSKYFAHIPIPTDGGAHDNEEDHGTVVIEDQDEEGIDVDADGNIHYDGTVTDTYGVERADVFDDDGKKVETKKKKGGLSYQCFAPPLIAPTVHRELVRQLNSRQRAIFDYVRRAHILHAADPTYPLVRVYLTGGAGVGKTFTLISIVNEIRLLASAPLETDHMLPKVLVMAFTGKAACNVDGGTIHSTLNIPPGSDCDSLPESKEIDILQKNNKQVSMVVFDENGMIGANLMACANKRCCQIFRKYEVSYGGTHTVKSGDFFQLKPIMDKPLYGRRVAVRGEAAKTQLSWRKEFRMFELTKVMRQRAADHIHRLNRFRTGTQTDADLVWINKRVCPSWPPPLHIPVICKRWEEVHAHNAKVLAESKGSLVVLDAVDVRGPMCPTTVPIPTKHQHMGGLAGRISLKIGMLVELVSGNMDTTDHLSNGTDGVFMGTRQRNGKITHLWIEFPDEKTGQRTRGRDTSAGLYRSGFYDELTKTSMDAIPTWTAIPTIQKEIHLYGIKTNLVTRTQFRVLPAAARTIAHVQGLSLDAVGIDLSGAGDRHNQHGLAYMALARCKEELGIYLRYPLRHSDFRVDRDVVDEMARLRKSCLLHVHIPDAVVTENTPLLFSALNCRSLNAHADDVLLDFELQASDVLYLSETRWLTSDGHLAAPDASRRKREWNQIWNNEVPPMNGSRPHHGSVLMHDPTRLKLLHHVLLPFENGNEGIVAKFKACNGLNKIVVVAGVYHNPSSIPTKNFERLEHALCQLLVPECVIIILGDFNIDLLRNNAEHDDRKIAAQHEFMASHSLQQVCPMQPTMSIGGAMLDHIWTNAPFVFSRISTTYYSDHESVHLHAGTCAANMLEFTPPVEDINEDVEYEAYTPFSKKGRVAESLKCIKSKKITRPEVLTIQPNKYGKSMQGERLAIPLRSKPQSKLRVWSSSLPNEVTTRYRLLLNGENDDINSWPTNLTTDLGSSTPLSALKSLAPGAWLNGDVIRAYFKILRNKCFTLRGTSTQSCYLGDPEWYASLTRPSHGAIQGAELMYQNVMRWTRPVQMQSLGYTGDASAAILNIPDLIFPVHVDNSHWVIVHIMPDACVIRMYDSCTCMYSGTHATILENFLTWVKEELAHHPPLEAVHMRSIEWKLEVHPDVPQQIRANCGVFACMFARHIALPRGDRSTRYDFCENDMDKIRTMMLEELWTGEFMD